MEFEKQRAMTAADAPGLRAPRTRLIWALAVVVAALAVWAARAPLSAWLGVAADGGTRVAQHYTCPMHPSIDDTRPGSCPICGMKLVPVAPSAGIIRLDETQQRLGGVRIAAAAALPLHLSFSGAGRVTYDESSLTDVTVRVQGYVTQLFVTAIGQHVDLGAPLFAIETDKPGRALTTDAPAAGYVIYKDITQGALVRPGTRVFRIAAIDEVWVEADVEDRDLREVSAGQTAKVTLDYSPGRTYDARVAFVYPYMESSARTGRVRLALDNTEQQLRPGMYATVQFDADAGVRLQVPTSAVLYTGPRRLVFVSLGGGRFRAQEIAIGRESGGMTEVTSGLEPGQNVAVAGTFLLAAEARITTAAELWQTPAADGGEAMHMP